MKKIYMTPETTGVAIKTESFLLTLSSGSVKPEAPDSGLGDGGTIEGGGNGDNLSPAKLHSTNVWEAWGKY